MPTERRIRVLLVDDHALVRSGLRALLEAQGIEVVGETDTGISVVEYCRRLAPDIVLMDLTMPARGGVAATTDVRRACPSTRVIALTMHEDEVYARQALLAGADGYVLKKDLPTDLTHAIRVVARGQRYITPTLAHVLDDQGGRPPERRHPPKGPDVLTEREREVLSLIALGHTNAEIGARLGISEKTVETHRARVLAKLGLRTRADLVRFALEHGQMKA